MTNRCPVCGDAYTEVLRGAKVTIPAEYDERDVCHKSVQLAGGGSVGRWYCHGGEDR